MYSGVEDPGFNLSPEIVKLTGLTDEVLRNRQINWDLVRDLFAKSEIAIAHNASFDRSFLLKRPELAPLEIHWGCSVRHIEWHSKGFKTRALNYLAADHGFVNPFAHRALFDCATTFRLICPYIQEIIARSWDREVEVVAFQAPFEQKDKLRLRNYKWDPGERVWSKMIFEQQLAEERVFLEAEIYCGPSRHIEKFQTGPQ
jgi:DNA polymerase-3 subunit epsilon